jgi:hypothetical protein
LKKAAQSRLICPRSGLAGQDDLFLATKASMSRQFASQANRAGLRRQLNFWKAA